MSDDGWKTVKDSPILAGIDQMAPVLFWHAFQGALVDVCVACYDNRFYTHWRTIDDSAWIKSADRLPTIDDADACTQRCVIAENTHGDVRTIGWFNLNRQNGWTRWQRIPDPPQGYQELRKDKY